MYLRFRFFGMASASSREDFVMSRSRNPRTLDHLRQPAGSVCRQDRRWIARSHQTSHAKHLSQAIRTVLLIGQVTPEQATKARTPIFYNGQKSLDDTAVIDWRGIWSNLFLQVVGGILATEEGS